MPPVYDRSDFGVENLKDCTACGEPIRESATRCKYCQADQKSATCRACGEMISETATRCRHCQADQAPWRRWANWAVPVLSLGVAILALLPEIVPRIADAVRPAQEFIIFRTAGSKDGQLQLTFENLGSAHGMVGNDLICDVRPFTGAPEADAATEPVARLRFERGVEEIVPLDGLTYIRFDRQFVWVPEGLPDVSENALPSPRDVHRWLVERFSSATFRLDCALQAHNLSTARAGMGASTEGQAARSLPILLAFDEKGRVARG